MASLLRTTAVVTLLWATGRVPRAQPAPRPPDRPDTRIDGIHAINSRSAMVWADNGTLHIWRVELAGNSANAPISWTAIPAPPGLKTFKDLSAEEGSPQVHVNFGPDGALRVFWTDNEWESGEAHFKFDLHQAVSTDEGQTWLMYQSSLSEPGGGASQAGQCRFVDQQDGWMMLLGEGGGGHQPDMLITTTDGGSTWKTVADSDHHGAGRWPAAHGPQSLIVRSATVAALVVAQNLENELPLASAWTEDGGHTWINTAIPQAASWIGSNVAELARVKDDPAHPHRVCIDALLSRYDPASDSFGGENARYCSDDDGRTWLSPVRVPMPGLWHGSSIRSTPTPHSDLRKCGETPARCGSTSSP